MTLLPNTLLESTDASGEQEVERILRIRRDRDLVYVMGIIPPGKLPEERRLSEIESEIDGRQARILTADPFAYLQMPDGKIPERHRRRRDAAWAKIRPIVEAPNYQMFDPIARGKLVRTVIETTGCGKKDIYRYLCRYYQAGMTPNALLPYFHLCGHPKKARKRAEVKLGRPRMLTKLNGAPAGINIGPAEAEKLQTGYRQFHRKAPEDGGVGKRLAYEKTLQKFFHKGYEMRNGVPVPVLPPAEELPSYDQFIYWAEKASDFKETLMRRQGERRFNLRSRAVLGDSTEMAFGPGSLYQIDATSGDDWLVSALNRARRLSRPTIYFVVDSFSHMITGYYAGIVDASFFAAGLALENAITDKVAHCKKFGIEISPEEWPSCGLFEGILADRGELRGHSTSNLVASLGINVSNTSPFRADFKGTGERTFRSINDLLVHGLPGAVRKPKERGERDPRLAAGLIMHEFETLLIRAILYHNRRRIEGFRLQKDMIADGVEPRPVDLWAWGVRNCNGHLRNADPEIVRANLLPWAKASVTYRGIKYGQVFYGCDRAMREGWYEKARATKSWQVEVAYDPRLVDAIYLRIPGVKMPERCELLQIDRRFKGLSWPDVEDFFRSQKEARGNSRTSDHQALADFHAPVEAIVKNAVAAAATANSGLTKAEQLRNVRENRKAERRLESAATSTTPKPMQSTNNGNGKPNFGEEPSKDYVPPPSPVEMLRKQREAKWNGNE